MGIENLDTESDVLADADAAAAIAAFEQGFSSQRINSATAPAAGAPAADDGQSGAEETSSAEPAAATPQAARPARRKKDAAADDGGGEGASDPYAGLDPRVRDALAEQATLKHQLRSSLGRIGKLQADLETMRRTGAPSPSPAPAAGAPARAAGAPAASRSEVRERVRGEMPEVAEALDEIESRLAPAPSPAPAASPAASPAAQADDDPQVAALTKLDPQWAEKMNSTDFKLWTTTLPEDVQDEIFRTEQAMTLAPHLKAYDTYRASLGARPTQDDGGSAGQRGGSDATTAAARREARATRSAAAPAAGARGSPNRIETPDEAFARAFAQARGGTTT